MADAVIDKLNSLEQKMRKVIAANKKMTELSKKLKEENAELVEQANVYKQQLEEARQKLKVSTLAKRISDNPTEETRKLKIQINEYIREIDKCLSILNA